MSGRLDGKVAIVTGSTKGIGRGIATRFAAEGASVVVTGRDNVQGREVEQEIRAAGAEATYVGADLGRHDDVVDLVSAAVESYGKLTTLVNNGAITGFALGDKPFTEIDDDTLGRALQVNLYGLVWCCKHAIPHLVAAGGGAVVNISSAVAVNGTPGFTAYTATKGAMNSLSRSLAKEHAKDLIRVNTISTGLIESNEETAEWMANPAIREWLERLVPLPYFGTPDDIAWACVYLASDEARYVTAATLHVDGGATG